MIPLQEALDLLEVRDTRAVNKKNLKYLERRAQIRWNPERAKKLKLPNDAIERYEHNFGQIEEAIETLLDYLDTKKLGPPKAPDSKHFSRDDFAKSSMDTVESLRYGAAASQEFVKGRWDSIWKTSSRVDEESITLIEGQNVGAMFKEELRDQVPKTCIASFLYFVIVAVPLAGLITFVISAFASESAVGVFWRVVGVIIAIQGLACLIGLLPLSRYWLPRAMNRVIDFFVGMGTTAMDMIYHGSFIPYLGFISLAVIYMIYFFAWILYTVLFRPIYWIASLVFRGKTLPDKFVKARYFAGLAEWYLQSLLKKKPEAMTEEELLDLAYAHREAGLSTGEVLSPEFGQPPPASNPGH